MELNVKTSDTTKLAYIGDAVYEIFVRRKAIESGLKPSEMSRFSVCYVKADSQAIAMRALIKSEEHMVGSNGFSLTDDERVLAKRARNRTSTKAPRGSSVQVYKLATGLEALVGWLYLMGAMERLESLMEEIMNLIDNNNE